MRLEVHFRLLTREVWLITAFPRLKLHIEWIKKCTVLRQSEQDTVKLSAHRWTAAVPATQESHHISHICIDYDHPIHKYYLLFAILVDYQCTSVTKWRTKAALVWQVICLFRTFDFAMMIFYIIEISNDLCFLKLTVVCVCVNILDSNLFQTFSWAHWIQFEQWLMHESVITVHELQRMSSFDWGETLFATMWY